jgi:hypothetical protein
MEGELVPQRRPEPLLEDLEKLLKETKSFETMKRKLLELQIKNLKKRTRAENGVESLKPQSVPEPPKHLPEEKENADRIRATTHGLPGLQEPGGIGDIPEPPQPGVFGHATTGGERGVSGGRPLAGEPINVQPAAVLPQSMDSANHHAGLVVASETNTEKELGYIRDSVRTADHKAMFLLGVMIALLGYLITHNASAGWFRGIPQWSFADFLGVLSVIGLAVAAAMILSALYPSLRDLRLLSLPQLSKICLSKYRRLDFGFWIGVGAAFTSLLFLILSKKPPHVLFIP